MLDDIIVWWHHSGVIDVMPNASNTASVRSTLGGDDITTQRAVIAVQGPAAREMAALVCPSFGTVGHFRVEEIVWNGVECTVAGTGYTGERGLEISIPSSDAAKLWHALAEAGATPAGLGARDTLRLEAGLPLHGQELGPDITPLQAGLGWVVAFDTEFIGKDALLTEKTAGPSRRLVGIASEGVVHHAREILSCAMVRRSAASHQATFHQFFSTALRWALFHATWPLAIRLPSTFAL